MKAIKWMIMAFLCVLFSNSDEGQSGQDEPDLPPAHALVYCSAAPDTGDAGLQAALRDVALLKAQSPEQVHDEEYYNSLADKQTLFVSTVDQHEIRFAGAPQAFSGDYSVRFASGKAYPYFQEADMGGKRYYIVRDEFGVWVVFRYQVAFQACIYLYS